MSFEWLSPDDARQVLGYLEERFGIPADALAGCRLLRRGGYVCALRAESEPLARELQAAGGGLRLVKETGPGRFKPATRGMQVLGRLARRNVIDLDDATLRGLLQGQTVPVAEEGRGFVLLRWDGGIVGVGLLRAGQLVAQIPRTVTEHLRLPGEGPVL